jgi:hypothetical protein
VGLTTRAPAGACDQGASPRLYKWFKAHPRPHNHINSAVILSIFGADAFSLLGLPRLILAGDPLRDLRRIIVSSLAAGCLHSWLMYSLSVLSLREGAAHILIFSGTGAFARAGQFLGRNLCRLQTSEPHHYAACHTESDLGTDARHRAKVIRRPVDVDRGHSEGFRSKRSPPE